MVAGAPGWQGPGTGTTPGSRLPRRAVAYAASVVVVGFGLMVLDLGLELPRIAWGSRQLYGSYLLMLLLIAGELRRLRVIRDDGATDRPTVSSTFAVALVLTGPLSLAILAQLAATGLDDLMRRRPPLVLAFNQAQYVITFFAVRWAFTLPLGQPFFGQRPELDARAIAAAMLASAVYFVVNMVIVDGVIALVQRRRLVDLLRGDVLEQGMSSSILLAPATVAAVITRHSLLLVPLIVLPLLGVQRSAWIAAQRQHEALHDGLTGLPNRALFRLRAESAVQAAAGQAGNAAVLLADLDHFKEINDTLGHQAGDGLLAQGATRLTASMPAAVTVARLGGDDFAIVVPPRLTQAGLATPAEEMMIGLREPLIADGIRIGVHASVGIAVYPEPADTVESLLQHADVALYQAKVNRGEVCLYSADLDRHTVERLSLVGDLQAAFQSDEFELAYQPQIDSVSGSLVAVEALTRWDHPVQGAVPPDVFIPLAENSEMISTMTRRAVATALPAVSRMTSNHPSVSVSVNVSARLLSDLELPVWIEGCLRAANLTGERLTVEVTETSITADPVRAMQVLADVGPTDSGSRSLPRESRIRPPPTP